MNDLVRQAELWGVDTSYYDIRGERHEASEEALRRIIDVLSAPGVSPAPRDRTALQPQLAYQGNGRRVWVLAVQLYALRSCRNWGHGDFTDLADLLKLVAELGGAGVGLNPLHAWFYDRPGTGSPYSPSSRLFLNPLYIDVEAIPEYEPEHASGLTLAIAELRRADLIDYLAVAQTKLAALRKVYAEFVAHGSDARRQDFDAYRREQGRELKRFAAFETLRGLHQQPWPQWPQEWRQPTEEALARLRQTHADEIGFHEFLQWIADRQLARCREVAHRHGMAIGLYLDTAVGVDPQGADAWMAPDAVLGALSVGAPPDAYQPAGQDWGLTAYNPHALVAQNFEPFRKMVHAVMRHAGAVRIDHVLGLMRLFVIPHGLKTSDGVYLRLPFERMLSVVAEESRRCRCIVVGEDLGTVPEGFRDVMRSWGLWSYLVALFERNADGSFKTPREYPEMAIATFGTHDLPTFSGWISGHDLRMKRGIGVDPGETDEQRRHALEQLRHGVCSGEQPAFEFAAAFLADTPSRLVSISIEDVLEIVDQINVPGTIDQHPNWRRRLPVAVEEIGGDQRMRRIAATLARGGRGSSAS